MNKLTIALLAGVLVIAGLPAFAMDLPDYGSKNFSPPSDTPSHFANETEPVAARTADTTENDWSAVDAIAPQRSERTASAPSRSHGGRHGGHASSHRHGKYSFGRSGIAGHTAHAVSSGRRAASSRAGSGYPARPSTIAGPTRRAPVTASRAGTAKHGKTGSRQAKAAGVLPISVSDGGSFPGA